MYASFLPLPNIFITLSFYARFFSFTCIAEAVCQVL